MSENDGLFSGSLDQQLCITSDLLDVKYKFIYYYVKFINNYELWLLCIQSNFKDMYTLAFKQHANENGPFRVTNNFL